MSSLTETKTLLKPTIIGKHIALITTLSFLTIGCGSSDDDSDGANLDPDPTEETDEGSSDDTEVSSDEFPSFQGVINIEESEVEGVRSLDLSAGFVDSEDRVFQGHQFLIGRDQCQEILGGGVPIPPPAILYLIHI